MRRIFKIVQLVLIIPFYVASCNYLDIIPPDQPDFDDVMKDESAVLSFLYTCYSGVPLSQPYDFKAFEQSADEVAAPPSFSDYQQQVAWGTISPAYYNSWGGDDMNIWVPSYNWIGYVHHFQSLIDDAQPTGVTGDDKALYKAETYFLEAYYHFRVLQAFGPCPLITAKVDPNILATDIPGRSHFDYCVDYIVNKLDQAALTLPPTRGNSDLGRATSTICKALKARVLLYAASPLWNGSFPNPGWKNKSYETPGYGYDLVGSSYERSKWERALTACEEALTAATAAGHQLFDVTNANNIATLQQVQLPFIPGKEDDTEENRKFKECVRMFQYLVTANEGDGNKELIWAQRIGSDNNNWGEATDCRLPAAVVQRSNSIKVGGWSSLAPTLYAVQHFYTENGSIPSQDDEFYSESEWYERFYTGATSPSPATGMDGENVKNDIIKLNAKREARFYAWIVFDGSQYSAKISGGQPLWINFKNENTNGWNKAGNERNCVGTGYLSKKFIDPNMEFGTDGSRKHTAVRRPYIRMAELYLNLAECYAALDNTEKALENLNTVRRRAGVKDVSGGDFAKMSLTDWVRNERFIELYEEGHRYYDLRRWTIAPEMLKAGARYGLNGLRINPSFEEFNRPTLIDQPFRWDNRLYLLPVWSRSGMDELYSNPQLVQALGY